MSTEVSHINAANQRIVTTSHSKRHPSETMKALQWLNEKKVRVAEVPRPVVTQPHDAIIRVTTTTICGSDLHMYHKAEIGMKPQDIMGHETMGIVEEIGSGVKELKKGDRVVISAVIACGDCKFCRDGYFSCCDKTNPSPQMDEAYGQRISGIFGYTHQTGGFDGGQAEFVRVPIADFNCLKVPDDLSDEKVLFLSDIVCTSWFGNELTEVKEGQTVAVWGCGPVGLLSLMWAKFRGAKRIIALDSIQYRLDKAKELGALVINIETESDVVGAILKIKKKGPHCCIDCTGWHPRKEELPKSPMKASESNMALNQAMDCARKTGRIAVIGDYFGYVDNFHIGALAIKALQMKSGQVPVHRFWVQLLELIRKEKIDPTFVITHRFPFEKAEEAYKIFDNREQNVLKIILKMEKTLG